MQAMQRLQALSWTGSGGWQFGAAELMRSQRELLREMLLIRRFEEKCVELYSASKIRGFMHLYIGEEAVATGVMENLLAEDAVVATYREHGHALAHGAEDALVFINEESLRTECFRFHASADRGSAAGRFGADRHLPRRGGARARRLAAGPAPRLRGCNARAARCVGAEDQGESAAGGWRGRGGCWGCSLPDMARRALRWNSCGCRTRSWAIWRSIG